MDKFKSLFSPKKVTLSDVVSPKPSKAATKALDVAIKRAYKDQHTVSQKASALRAN